MTKVCPLMNGDCCEKHCAWWHCFNDNYGECTIVTIAEELNVFKEDLTQSIRH